MHYEAVQPVFRLLEVGERGVGISFGTADIPGHGVPVDEQRAGKPNLSRQAPVPLCAGVVVVWTDDPAAKVARILWTGRFVQEQDTSLHSTAVRVYPRHGITRPAHLSD